MRIEIKFALVSIALGSAIGFLGQYQQSLQFEFPPINSNPSTTLEWQAVAIASVLVEYLVTLLVFYALGRTKVPKFRTGLLASVIYASGLLGDIAGQAAILLVPVRSFGLQSLFLFPYGPIASLDAALTFLLVAFSGIAFTRLGSGEFPLPTASRKTGVVISLIAFGFFFGPNFWFGYFAFRLSTSLPAVYFVVYADLALVFLSVLQFLIFYFAGRKVSIVGRPLRYFGLLFIGAYLGAVLGTVVSVTLYGQSYWSFPTGGGGGSFEYGIIFNNVPESPLLILESLIPVQSLPFLAFFAMSISRLGSSESSQSQLQQAPINEEELTQHDNLVGGTVTEHGG